MTKSTRPLLKQLNLRNRVSYAQVFDADNLHGRADQLNLNVNCTDLTALASNVWVRGSKLFELSNHLENVLATVIQRPER